MQICGASGSVLGANQHVILIEGWCFQRTDCCDGLAILLLFGGVLAPLIAHPVIHYGNAVNKISDGIDLGTTTNDQNTSPSPSGFEAGKNLPHRFMFSPIHLLEINCGLKRISGLNSKLYLT